MEEKGKNRIEKRKMTESNRVKRSKKMANVF